ncbi:MAG: FAD/NAD(P)-binding protein [Paracoccaceae bacterium]
MTEKPTIVIIGGGLSGAAVAYHLAGLLPPGEVDLAVVEPRSELGRGLAYSAADPDHRLNVPDHKMSLRTDQMDHFQKWLAAPHAPVLPADAADLTGEVFAPRAMFGSYVAAQLAPLLDHGRIRHVRATVIGIDRDERYTLRLSDGGVLQADLIILAATHPKAALPKELAALSGLAALIADPLAPTALDGIDPDERILIIGNGLTSADIVATLHRRGHRSQITALSRHGWRSMPHGPKQGDSAADFANDPARTALGLYRRVRQALVIDTAAGLTWHAAFDRLRAQGPAVWAALPDPERRRVLRHLRALWDVHRFRIAPQTLYSNLQMQRAGRLTHLAARITGVQVGATVEVWLTARHDRLSFPLAVDRIILATGPAHGAIIAATPALADLAALGMLQRDPLGLGLYTLPNGHAVPMNGQPDGSVLIAGPLARGAVGELMGVPEVISWAEHIAREAAAQVQLRQSRLIAQ